MIEAQEFVIDNYKALSTVRYVTTDLKIHISKICVVPTGYGDTTYEVEIYKNKGSKKEGTRSRSLIFKFKRFGEYSAMYLFGVYNFVLYFNNDNIIGYNMNFSNTGKKYIDRRHHVNIDNLSPNQSMNIYEITKYLYNIFKNNLSSFKYLSRLSLELRQTKGLEYILPNNRILTILSKYDGLYKYSGKEEHILNYVRTIENYKTGCEYNILEKSKSDDLSSTVIYNNELSNCKLHMPLHSNNIRIAFHNIDKFDIMLYSASINFSGESFCYDLNITTNYNKEILEETLEDGFKTIYSRIRHGSKKMYTKTIIQDNTTISSENIIAYEYTKFKNKFKKKYIKEITIMLDFFDFIIDMNKELYPIDSILKNQYVMFKQPDKD